MTGREMQIEFERLAATLGPDISNKLLSDDVFMYINMAIRAMAVEARQQFEKSQVIIDSFKSLLRTEDLSTAPYNREYNAVFASLEGVGYEFFVRARALVIRENPPASAYSRVKQVQQDDIERTMDDPFNDPTPYEIPMYFVGTNIVLRKPVGFDISELRLTFVKTPAIVGWDTGQDCDLDEVTHPVVVQQAVALAVKDLQSRERQPKE